MAAPLGPLQQCTLQLIDGMGYSRNSKDTESVHIQQSPAIDSTTHHKNYGNGQTNYEEYGLSLNIDSPSSQTSPYSRTFTSHRNQRPHSQSHFPRTHRLSHLSPFKPVANRADRYADTTFEATRSVRRYQTSGGYKLSDWRA